MVLCNLITTNIEESFLSAYNNIIPGFFLSILSSLWITSEQTMKFFSWKRYKRMILHWMHNGTGLFPSQYYSLAMKSTKYFPNLEKIHSMTKTTFTLHTLPFKTLGFSICDTWQDNPTIAKNWSNFKLLFTKEADNIKHQTTELVRFNDEAINDILQLIEEFASKQQEIVNMRDVQEQPVNSTS